MNTEDDFQSLSIAIVGLGLMGGSLALALKGTCKRLLAVDQDPAAVEMALSMGLVQRASVNAAEILPLADLLILAVPVRGVLQYLEHLDLLHPGKAIVLDLGSTKSDIVAAMAGLPERFDPIGGHPMCGKETSGLAQADAILYRGAVFALSMLERTSQRARGLALRLVSLLGSRPLWIDPQEHDAWIAVTSHLPYLVANSLAGSASCQVAPLIGPGFRSSTRLAGSSLPMMIDILATNQENILMALATFKQRIEDLEHSLALQDWASLENLLSEGAGRYHELSGGLS